MPQALSQALNTLRLKRPRCQVRCRIPLLVMAAILGACGEAATPPANAESTAVPTAAPAIVEPGNPAEAPKTTANVAVPVKGDQLEWMAMLLNGKKTGYMKLERDVEGEQVTTQETVSMSLNRGPATIEIKTVDTSTETLAGKPLAFTSVQDISSMTMTVSGTIDNGTVTAVTKTGGDDKTQSFPWPSQALMPEGLRQKILQHGLKPGVNFTVKAFMPSALQAVDATVTIGERELIDLFGVESNLIRVEQSMDLGGGGATTAVAWVTDDYDIKKMRFEIMGMTLETIACPRECALSESEPTAFFVNSFAHSPRALNDSERSKSLTYRINLANPEIEFTLPESSEQRVKKINDESFDVTISVVQSSPEHSPFDGTPEDYLTDTRWLQSNADSIVSLAKKAQGNARDSRQTMLNLQDFVREYVDDKNLAVGYASALEVARDRSGDCTEHALLLAALGRALGIPTRVATGLAYVDSWLGAERIFVPHAWAQALIDGHWISYDAALGQFDAGHIALSYGDGDPFGFYSSVNALGNIEIESISGTP